MQVEPLRPDLRKFLVKRGLIRKFEKQRVLFLANPRHPSLNTERLEPKEFKIYSFRIDKKYRAVFIFKTPATIEVVDINDHYQRS